MMIGFKIFSTQILLTVIHTFTVYFKVSVTPLLTVHPKLNDTSIVLKAVKVFVTPLLV